MTETETRTYFEGRVDERRRIVRIIEEQTGHGVKVHKPDSQCWLCDLFNEISGAYDG